MTDVGGSSETAIRLPASRLADVLWGSGLVSAAVGNLTAAVAGGGALAKLAAMSGIGLSCVGALVAFARGRGSLPGAIVGLACGVFAFVVSGRPLETAVLALDAAPEYTLVEDADDEGATVGQLGVGSSSSELMFHPGPVALSMDSPALLVQFDFVPSALVAGLWDGAWYAGRIVSVGGSHARVHFVGWESDLDLTLSRDQLRGLEPRYLPKPLNGAAALRLGFDAPMPNAMTIAVLQPGGELDGTDLSRLAPRFTLYATRLDVTNVALGTAIAGLETTLPFALLVNTLLRIDESNSYYFDAASDGTSQLWVDDVPLQVGEPLNLGSGVHSLRLEYRHRSGPTMTLGLRMGTSPQAMRPLDMTRNGIAQAALESDGSMRLVLSEGILFDLDRDELNASAERALDSLHRLVIAPRPSAGIRIEGHTDDRGSDEYNLALSQRRADRVLDWLLSRGRAPSSLGTQAFGESKPRLANTSDANRRANRRVELVVGEQVNASSDPHIDSSVNAARDPNITSVPNAGTSAATGTSAVGDLIRAYFRDLNEGSFDADRYFEPNVERFVTMRNTTTAAINHYILKVFPQQFRQHHFALEEGTLTQEGPNQYVFVEQARYTMAKKTTPDNKRVRVRVRTSPRGKLVFFHQYEVLK